MTNNGDKPLTSLDVVAKELDSMNQDVVNTFKILEGSAKRLAWHAIVAYIVCAIFGLMIFLGTTFSINWMIKH